MNTLDELYKECFLVSKDVEIEEYKDVFYLKNVFQDPQLVLKFQNLLSKWESCNSAKPGLMSLQLPYWTANYVHKQLFDYECDWHCSQTEFIYFYWNNECQDSDENNLLSNNCLIPHTDSDPGKNSFIFLVNLNKKSVRTGFWKFKGNRICKNFEESDEYDDYVVTITEENLKKKTNNGILDKEGEIEYAFNEGIIYPSNRYHQPIIDKFYTRDNPRILLRYSYDKL
jgi:hypothetical protein